MKLLSISTAGFAIPFAVLAALITAVVLVSRPATAYNHHELQTIGYGYPFTWIHQDETAYYQQGSFPASVSLGSPWEVSTDVEPGPFFADWAIIASVILTALLLVAGVMRLAASENRLDIRPAGAD